MKKFVLFLLLALASPLLAQDNLQMLRGMVADETGEALIGATVVVKNSKGETLGGASTSVDGNFTCNVHADDIGEVLISYIGFETVKLSTPKPSLNLFVVLKGTGISLPTVTIVGQSIQMKQTTRCILHTRNCPFPEEPKSLAIQAPTGQLNLWPNPTISQINMELPLDAATDIYIFDSTGRLVHLEQAQVSSIHTVPVVNWTSGVYTVLLSNIYGQVSKQFVVAR